MNSTFFKGGHLGWNEASGFCDWRWSHDIFLIEGEDGTEVDGRHVGGFSLLLDFRAAFSCFNFSFFSKLDWYFIFIALNLSA